MARRLAILLALIGLAACGGSETAGTTGSAAAPVMPEALPAPTGRGADGAYFLGQPDAPVTLIDYSDFL